TYPRIELTLLEDQTDALLAALAAAELHAALVGLGRYDRPPPDLEGLLVAREPLVVAVHPTHPLAGHDQVQLRSLREEPMVTLTRASKLRSPLETACQAAGFAPRITAETSDLGVMVQLAADQLGVAVLPASGLAGRTPPGPLRPPPPAPPRRPPPHPVAPRLLLAWRPAASPPAGRAFLALARQHLAPLPGST